MPRVFRMPSCVDNSNFLVDDMWASYLFCGIFDTNLDSSRETLRFLVRLRHKKLPFVLDGVQCVAGKFPQPGGEAAQIPAGHLPITGQCGERRHLSEARRRDLFFAGCRSVRRCWRLRYKRVFLFIDNLLKKQQYPGLAADRW